ncbi:MAG: GTPase Era [Ignavibacteria bacterium]|nr:GTPase Era [Ignavibacteria bacterium]
MDIKEFKCGYVAILGEPNVGKSTLMNSILKTKISITTPKPQTTRKKILGIYSDNDSQIIFLDTPGLIEPKYLLQKAMVESINSALYDADIILVVIDVHEKTIRNFDDKILKVLQSRRTKKITFLIINKIDLIDKEKVIELISQLQPKFAFEEIFPISALKGFNIDELVSSIKKYLPIHPPFYPTDILSQEPERFFISEIIREKIFDKYKEEIPYSTEVVVVEYKEREKGKDYISAEIYVEKESQKKIIIGSNGRALKKIGELARADIEAFLGKGVYLELFVKVRENWRDSEHWIKSFGYLS